VQIHGNAKLVPSKRLLLIQRVCEEQWTVAAAAAAQGVSERTVYRWLARWRSGDRQLVDRTVATEWPLALTLYGDPAKPR
jgi:transposase-like protein